jgi:hypothetical protein
VSEAHVKRYLCEFDFRYSEALTNRRHVLPDTTLEPPDFSASRLKHERNAPPPLTPLVPFFQKLQEIAGRLWLIYAASARQAMDIVTKTAAW